MALWVVKEFLFWQLTAIPCVCVWGCVGVCGCVCVCVCVKEMHGEMQFWPSDNIT